MEESLQCQTCDKEFKFKRTLKEHQLIHTGQKPYKCTKCSQHFRQFSSLQKHDRIHTGSKPYQCEQCNSSFSQISNLKRHQLKHLDNKPYKCEDCEKTFITNQNYQQHREKHQFQRSSVFCDCGKSFLYKSSLKKHQKKQHKQHEIDHFFNLQNQVQDLKNFFTATHPQIIHMNHIDVLFNGRLYKYNENNGRIELHELQDTNDTSCVPISNHQHFEQQEQFAKLNCTNCKMEQCCCIDKNLNACCLACNGGHCGEQPQASSKLLHFHGPNCGHPIVLHNGHIDYLVNEVLHYPHDDHCDHHGVLNRIIVQ